MRNQTLNEAAFRMLTVGKYAFEEIVTILGLFPDEVRQLNADIRAFRVIKQASGYAFDNYHNNFLRIVMIK